MLLQLPSHVPTLQRATKMIRHLKIGQNFGSDASNFMKHHQVWLCTDHGSYADSVLEQLGVIHRTLATNQLQQRKSDIHHKCEF